MCSRYITCYSALPEHWVEPFIPFLQESYGSSYYLFGSDYIWPQKMNEAIRRVVGEVGGEVVGEEYTPFGVKDFTPTVRKISGSGAEVVVITVVGADAITFVKQFVAAGGKTGQHDRLLRLQRELPVGLQPRGIRRHPVPGQFHRDPRQARGQGVRRQGQGPLRRRRRRQQHGRRALQPDPLLHRGHSPRRQRRQGGDHRGDGRPVADVGQRRGLSAAAGPSRRPQRADRRDHRRRTGPEEGHRPGQSALRSAPSAGPPSRNRCSRSPSSPRRSAAFRRWPASDLALGAGELRCIIGPNGCGKTTLFNVDQRRLRADAGRIRFGGRGHHRAAPAYDRPARHRPQVPGARDLPEPHGRPRTSRCRRRGGRAPWPARPAALAAARARPRRRLERFGLAGL